MWLAILKLKIKAGLRIFYKRHQVVGKENIPKDGSIVYAPNHQNSLMDSLNLITNLEGHPYSATRADVFKKAWVKKVLLYLKMYPVYRPKDGRASMSNNDGSFDFFSDKLKRGEEVAIFPEGAPAYQHELLQLKKGAARLALRTVSESPSTKVYLQPVGINYSDLFTFKADLLILFGKPILVNDYLEIYKKHEGKALRQIMLAFRAALKKVMHDIPRAEYDFLNNSRKAKRIALLNAHPNSSLHTLFKEEQKVLNDLAKLKEADPESYAKKQANSQGAIPQNPKKNPIKSVLKLLLLPLILLGVLTHAPLAYWIKRKAESAKDRQFYTTFKFLLGFVLYPFCYLLVFGGSCVFLPMSYSVLVMLVLVVSGSAAAWAV